MSKRLVYNCFFVLVFVLIDQLSKLLVERFLPFQEVTPIVPSFALFRTWNDGVAFSFLSGFGGLPLVMLALLVISIVIWLWRSSDATRIILNFGYALIIGGAIGNIIDRAIYGHVVDFFLIYYGNWSFAVFNVADSFITVGAILIATDELFLRKPKETE